MIVIHHHPGCGTSRNVLAFIRATGEAPVVIDYIKTGWTRPQLLGLFAAANLTPAQALRTKGTEAEAMGLIGASDEAILDAIIAMPALVERPFVCSPRGVRLCRPSQTVFDLLDSRPAGLTKEDRAPAT